MNLRRPLQLPLVPTRMLAALIVALALLQVVDAKAPCAPGVLPCDMTATSDFGPSAQCDLICGALLPSMAVTLPVFSGRGSYAFTPAIMLEQGRVPETDLRPPIDSVLS